MTNLQHFLTVKEVAEYLGVTANALHNRGPSGESPSFPIR